MLREVIFRDDQKIVTPDLNNLSQFSRETFDALVTNAVSSMRYFSGFGVTKSGQAEITITAGHYWAGGPVFVRSTSTVFNLLTGGSYLPVVTKRKVAIVVYGETITTDVQDRSFVIDDQGNTEPQSVAMERLRYARLALVAGAESPDPQKPTLDVGVIPVGWITLNTSGVIDGSIEVANDYKLPSIESLKQLIAAIELWRAQIGQVLDTIQSELIRTQAMIPPDILALLANMAMRMDALEKLARQPASAVKTFIDRFIDLTDSDTAASGYSARVDNGLHFPSGAPVYAAVVLANPLDAKVKRVNNIILPAWTERPRISVLDFDSELSISQYPVTTYESRQVFGSRQVTTYGDWVHSGPSSWYLQIAATVGYRDQAEFNAIINTLTANSWANGATQTFSLKSPGGETYTFEAVNQVDDMGFQGAVLFRQANVKTWEQYPYWTTVNQTSNVTGSTLIQTFKNVTNGWMTAVGLYFSQVAGSGDLTLEICEVNAGRADLSKVLGRGTVNAANLTSNAEVKVQINPTYVMGGRDYAYVLRSSGNHFVRIATGNKYAQGTLSYITNTGAQEAVQNSGDLCFQAYFAQFANTRVEVQMNNLDMPGGMSAIKIIAATIVPEGCDLIWEIQRAGKWYQISRGEVAALQGYPTNVALRAVFIGTTDLMPGIDMSQIEAELTKTLTALVHESKAHALAAASTSVQVHCYVEGWDAAAHSLTCTLVGTSGTPVSPAATVTDIDPEFPQRVRRRFTFAPSSTSSYKVRLAGSTSDATKFFSVDTRYDFAF